MLGDVTGRVTEGIMLSVLVIFATRFADALSTATQPEYTGAMLILFGLSNLGLFVALFGFIAVTARGGPLASVGFLFELGATSGIQNGNLNIGALILGGILVVVGTAVWDWSYVGESSW